MAPENMPIPNSGATSRPDSPAPTQITGSPTIQQIPRRTATPNYGSPRQGGFLSPNLAPRVVSHSNSAVSLLPSNAVSPGTPSVSSAGESSRPEPVVRPPERLISLPLIRNASIDRCTESRNCTTSFALSRGPAERGSGRFGHQPFVLPGREIAPRPGRRRFELGRRWRVPYAVQYAWRGYRRSYLQVGGSAGDGEREWECERSWGGARA